MLENFIYFVVGANVGIVIISIILVNKHESEYSQLKNGEE